MDPSGEKSKEGKTLEVIRKRFVTVGLSFPACNSTQLKQILQDLKFQLVARQKNVH